MSNSTSTRALRLIAAPLLALALLLLVQAAAASAEESVKVGLKPVADSGVYGLATVTATSGGGATVEMQVSALTPGSEYRALLLAGTCAMPSASFGVLGTLQADATGKASLSANSARFSGGGMVTDLNFAGLTDGYHIISVAGQTVVACGAIPSAQAAPTVHGGVEFRLGFRTLASYIPNIVGQPLEEEYYNPINGDSLQQTTTGLMVWRKADNWTAFTNGSMTWINGPEGIQIRPNDERFPWEVGSRG